MALIIGIVAWEKAGHFNMSSALTAIGESSCSLYLTHSLTISITYKILERLELTRALPCDLVFIILIFSAVTVGIITSLLLEMPAIKLVNKMIFHAKKTRTVPEPDAVQRRVAGRERGGASAHVLLSRRRVFDNRPIIWALLTFQVANNVGIQRA